MTIEELEAQIQAELERLNDAGQFATLRRLISVYAAETDSHFDLHFVGTAIKNNSSHRVAALAGITNMRVASTRTPAGARFGVMPKENHGKACNECGGRGFVL